MKDTKKSQINIISMKMTQTISDKGMTIKAINIKENRQIETRAIMFSDIPKKYQYIFLDAYKCEKLDLEEICNQRIEQITSSLKGKFSVELTISLKKITSIQLLFDNNTFNVNKSSYYLVTYSVCQKDVLLSSRYEVFKNINERVITSFFERLTNELHFLIHQEKIGIELSDFSKLAFTAQAAAIFIHEGIGHFLESDYYKISPIQSIDETFNGLTIYENFCNDELIKDQMNDSINRKILLVDNGKIVNLLSNRFFSELFEIPNSGNSIFSFNPLLVRMRNMRVEVNSKETDFVSLDNNTLFIEEIISGDMNPLYGCFSIVILKARNCSGNYYKPFTIHFDIRNYKNYLVQALGKHEKVVGLCGKLNEMIPVELEIPPILLTAVRN